MAIRWQKKGVGGEVLKEGECASLKELDIICRKLGVIQVVHPRRGRKQLMASKFGELSSSVLGCFARQEAARHHDHRLTQGAR